MAELAVTTFDRVPEMPCRFVRDLRIRWAPQEAVADRQCPAGPFSVADILKPDVLCLVDRLDGLAGHPAWRDDNARAAARSGFARTHADQMAHFAAVA